MRKNAFSISLILFFSSSIFAQSTGINFTQKPWQEILQQAKAEDKLVFVDAYTTWCGPCKQMSKAIFPDEKVGQFFNTQFISAKIDMEKGEGRDLAKKFNVRAYPTLLFVDASGNMVHQSVGFHNVNQLLELGSDAVNPMKQLGALDAKYAAGERSTDFLYNYALASAAKMDGSETKITEEYLATQSDWNSDKNAELIYRFSNDIDSKLFEYFLKNKGVFIEKFGERAVSSRIQNMVQSALFEKDGDVLANAEKVFPLVYPERAEEMISSFKMQYYYGAGDDEKYAQQTIAHYKKYNSATWDELNEAAWNFYETVEKKKYLKKGIKMAKQSISLSNQYYNNDTLAALYYKLGKKGKALAAANKALYLAKEEGEDATETEELLEKIKAM